MVEMIKSNHPFFTIIVPTFNQSHFLGAALDSIISQTDSDWEAVVVNDGSTDDTSEIMEKYAEKDARIRLFHKANGGVASALNEGLRLAQGQWVCWLSSDDMFDPRKLEIHREWISRHPDSRFFFTYFRLLRDATGEVTDHDLWGPLPEPEFQLLILFYRNYISGISICVNREAWNRVGFFNESFRYAQDIDMWMRFLAVYPGTFIPEWTCINRNHALQGSEVFPQACYYDTAKAAIRFINDHNFEGLFPLLNLDDPQAAIRAVEKTLEIAAEPSAFLYSLGTHPALFLRLLEWGWGAGQDHDDQLKRTLRQMILQKMSNIVHQNNGSAFSFLGKAVMAAIQVPQPMFEYKPLSTSMIGEMHYYDSQLSKNNLSIPLRQYLDKFENLQVSEWAEDVSFLEVVLLLPPTVDPSFDGNEVFNKILKVSKKLSQRGWRVLLAGRSKKRLGMAQGLLFLGAEDEQSLKLLLIALGRMDALVSLSSQNNLKWANAARKVVYDLSTTDNFDEEMVVRQIFDLMKSAPVQKDYSRIFIDSIKNKLKKIIRWVRNSINAMRHITF